jgi:hypothetical protein
VLRHSTLYAFGNIANRAVAFLAIPFYARFLSPAQYGLIELSTQTVAIASPSSHRHRANPNAVHLGGSSRYQNFLGCCDFNKLQPAV